MKLIILSDLWGFDDSHWIKNYTKLLETDFSLVFYNSYKLAGIDKTNLTEKELHSQFVHGGLHSAASRLLQLENKEINVLAFSIGGTIAWKAALKGLKINKFFSVSSTRLRYEIEKPHCYIELFFGEKDLFKPEQNWFEKLNLAAEIIEGEGHEIYKKKYIAQKICNQIKSSR